MARFKKPLSGVSRLSDRVGGGKTGPILVRVTPGPTSYNGIFIVPPHDEGDLLLLSVSRSGSTGAPAVPSGWTFLEGAAFTGQTGYNGLYYKIGEGSTSYNNLSLGLTDTRGAVLVFKNHDGIGEVARRSISSTGTITAPDMPNLDPSSGVFISSFRSLSGTAERGPLEGIYISSPTAVFLQRPGPIQDLVLGSFTASGTSYSFAVEIKSA